MSRFFTPHARERFEERYGFAPTIRELSQALIACESTATSYCWLVWSNCAHDWEEPNWKPDGGTRFVWIPPCRAKLERDTDYPAPQEAA